MAKSERKGSLCDLCLRPKTHSCRAYEKDPSVQVVDCGRFDPNKDIVNFYEQIARFLNPAGNNKHKK